MEHGELWLGAVSGLVVGVMLTALFTGRGGPRQRGESGGENQNPTDASEQREVSRLPVRGAGMRLDRRADYVNRAATRHHRRQAAPAGGGSDHAPMREVRPPDLFEDWT